MKDALGWTMGKRVINPLVIALLLSSVLLVAAGFRINEAFAAVALVAVFLIITIFNAANGLAFVFFAAPFFLCESNRPFSWMMDAFIYGFIAAWGIRRIAEGFFRPPLFWPAVFVALAAVICFPVDLKEYLLSFTTWPPSRQFYLARVGWGYPNSLRLMFSVVSGAVLFFAAWDVVTRAGEKYLHSLLRGVVALAGLYCVIGAVMLHRLPVEGRPEVSYLGMSLVGVWNASTTPGVWTPSFTALAYNPQFTVQWLAPLIPLAAFFAFLDRGKAPWLAVHLASLALIAYALYASGQRSAVIMTGIFATVTLAAIFFIQRRTDRAPWPAYVAIPSIVSGAVVGGVIAWRWIGIPASEALEALGGFIDDPLYLNRYGITDARFFLWHTAARMAFFHPLTGVGLGRFHPLFYDYFDSAQRSFQSIGFATGSAHSMYFQTLAEQGIVGMAVWSLFVTGVFKIAHRGLFTENRWFAAAVSTSLAIWLILGIPHDMMFVRSIGIQFWILSAFAVYSGGSVDGAPFSSRRVVIGVIAALAVVFTLRAGQSAARPISKNFAEGFHQWEAQPDGTAARWTGGGALMGVQIKGSALALDVSAPIPDLDKKPQVARIVFDGQEREIIFTDASWKTVTFSVNGRAGETRLLKIKVDHVFNPSQSGAKDDRDLGVMVKEPRWAPGEKDDLDSAKRPE